MSTKTEIFTTIPGASRKAWGQVRPSHHDFYFDCCLVRRNGIVRVWDCVAGHYVPTTIVLSEAEVESIFSDKYSHRITL